MFCFFKIICYNISISKRGISMKNFIANNWIAIICVLVAIIVGLAVTWIIMDRKDKKLIAEYKTLMKAAKADANKAVAEPAEEVEEVKEEVKEEPKQAPAKKPATKSNTAKASTSKSTTAKKSTSKTTKK